MLKIYRCCSLIDSSAPAMLATPPIGLLGVMVDVKMI